MSGNPRPNTPQQTSIPRGMLRGPGGGGHGPMDFRRARDTKGTLRGLVRLLSDYKFNLIVVFLLMVLAAYFNARGPYILGQATNEIADGIGRISAGDGGMDMGALGRILVMLVAIYLCGVLFSYLQSFLLVDITQKLTYSLTGRIETKLHHLPLSYFDSTPLGDILSRVTNDVTTVTSSLQQNLPNMLSSLLSLVMVLIAMLSLSPLLTLVGMITLPLTFFFSARMVKYSQKYFQGQQKSLGEISGYVEENFTGHTVIRAYGKERESQREFEKINERLYGYSWKSQFISGDRKSVV